MTLYSNMWNEKKIAVSGHSCCNRDGDTGLSNAELASYALNATHRISRDREVDQPHWTVRCRACHILSECYSLYKQRLWRWPTALDCQMPSLLDTLWMLLTGLAEIVNVTNHTGQSNAELTSDSLNVAHWISRDCEGHQPHWSVRCRACLIVSECFSLD